MSAPSRNAARAALVVGLLALTAPTAAQTPPAKIESRDLALTWLAGRWAQPVTCERSDGSSFERERALGFRVAPGVDSGRTGLRATFYGIEAADAKRCYNLVESELVDLRGTVYLHMRSHAREDMGLFDFRRMLSDGALDYHVTRGTLRWRAIGGADDWTSVEVPAGARLHVDEILPGSDAARLFAARGQLPNAADSAAPRLLRFELRDVPDLAFSVPLREDVARRP